MVCLTPADKLDKKLRSHADLQANCSCLIEQCECLHCLTQFLKNMYDVNSNRLKKCTTGSEVALSKTRPETWTGECLSCFRFR